MNQVREVYHVYVNIQSLDESLHKASHLVSTDVAEGFARGFIAGVFGPAFAESLEMMRVGYTDITIIFHHEQAARMFIEAMRDVFPEGRDYWQIENSVRNIYGQFIKEELDAASGIWEMLHGGDLLIPSKDVEA